MKNGIDDIKLKARKTVVRGCMCGDPTNDSPLKSDVQYIITNANPDYIDARLYRNWWSWGTENTGSEIDVDQV